MPQESVNTPHNSFVEALAGLSAGRARIVDLTHTLNERLPPWPGDTKSFEAMPNATIARDGYFTRSFWTLEHYGTHIDAPAHFPPGKTTVDQIPAGKLVGPAVVLTIPAESANDLDYQLPLSRVKEWEKAHGPIPEGGIAILRTGCSSKWPDAASYRNLDSAGAMHFPGFSVEAVQYLIAKRVSGIGADAMSVDPGNSKNYDVHRLALGSDLFQLENLADLSVLPEAGAWLIVAPIKLEGGSGGPCRVFAVVPE